MSKFSGLYLIHFKTAARGNSLAARAPRCQPIISPLVISALNSPNRMSTSVRILVLGAANGRLTEIFAKLSSLNAKAGPFDIVLCLGDLFGEAEDEYLQQLIAGEVEIPVSTYFTVGRRELPQPVRMLVGHGGQVCENLFFLGRESFFNGS